MTGEDREIRAQRRACDTCGSPVDPLRAPGVAHIDGEFRYYCSRDCYERRRGRRSVAPTVPALSPEAWPVPPGAASELPAVVSSAGPGDTASTSIPPATPADRPSIEQMADMLGLRRDSLPAEVRRGAVASWVDPLPVASSALRDVAARDAENAQRDAIPAIAAIAAALLAHLVLVPRALPDLARVVLTSLCALVACAAAGRELFRARRLAGSWFVWLPGALGPLGMLVLAARSTGDVPTAVRLASAAALAAVTPVAIAVVRARLRRAQTSLAVLARVLPRMARVVRAAGETESLEASRVRAGEEVVVAAGEAVPVDGVVRAGPGLSVWRAGDAARACAEGDSILAGARVTEGTLRVLATRAGDDVALARLPRLMAAGAEMPVTVRFGERIARGLPFVAVAVAVGGAVAHVANGGQDPVGVALMAFAAAPWALCGALARVPFMDAMGMSAQRGIVFRDAVSVEDAATVGAVVLCMRGTVTSDRPELVDVVSVGSRGEDEIIAVAAAAESVMREHPIARAIIAVADKRGARADGVRRPSPISGRGVTAVTAAGEGIAVGSRQLLLEEGVSVAPAEDVARALESQRRNAIFVALAGRVEGVLGLEDPLRDEARPAVQAMMDAGFDLALLSGESRGTAEAVGLALDVSNVRPEVPPDERAGAVRALAEVANAVAVVGRPERDGAALGAADVAISLAAAGAAGGETAVALVSDDLRDAAAALSSARRGRERALRVITVASIGAVGSAALLAVLPGLGALAALLCGGATAGVAYLVSLSGSRRAV